MGRWKDICNMRYSQEDRYQRVAAKMRKRFLRDAFSRYLSWFKWQRQHDVNIRGAAYMKDKLDKKTK